MLSRSGVVAFFLAFQSYLTSAQSQEWYQDSYGSTPYASSYKSDPQDSGSHHHTAVLILGLIVVVVVLGSLLYYFLNTTSGRHPDDVGLLDDQITGYSNADQMPPRT